MLFSSIFEIKFSRLFIIPYCLFFGLDNDYLDQFEPEAGKGKYESYSDFFKRRYKAGLRIDSERIWPCEGFICEWGTLSQIKSSRVKGNIISPSQIFKSAGQIPPDYFFLNIFLHNHNYHRIHAPLNGKIVNITRTPGDLVFLRPWFYSRENVSEPAFRNERLTIELEDRFKKTWYLTMVGGFGVGTIELENSIVNGTTVQIGQELCHFRLGSSVCIASPMVVQVEKYLQEIRVGECMNVIYEELEKRSQPDLEV